MISPALELILIVGLSSFLIGSIPFGLFIAKAFRTKDIRTKGSGNVGATNVTRVVGFFPAGLLTLLLDVSKGAIPVLLVRQQAIMSPLLQWLGVAEPLAASSPWLAGLAAVFGHCYSPWLNFRGGKGVATGFGIFLVLSPVSALVGAIGFALVFRDTRIGSLSSLSGALAAMITLAVLSHDGEHLFAAAAILFLILLRHDANMDALLEGRENVFR